MTANASRRRGEPTVRPNTPEVHAPTLEDPTPCKTACATCGLWQNVEQLNEIRKKRLGHANVMEIMRGCIKPADWKAIIEKQLELAREGNKGAFEALMEYTLGRPGTMEPPQPESNMPGDYIFALLEACVKGQDEPDPERNPNLRDMPPYVPPKETPRYHYDPDED